MRKRQRYSRRNRYIRLGKRYLKRLRDRGYAREYLGSKSALVRQVRDYFGDTERLT